SSMACSSAYPKCQHQMSVLCRRGDDLAVFPDAEANALRASLDQQVWIEYCLVTLQLTKHQPGIGHQPLDRPRHGCDRRRHFEVVERADRNVEFLPVGAGTQ